ncbi:hypothetical protein RND81_07G119800 [Saponaria officinalis]|uniref:Uncharacterized protein n=1 Tax=Saponaria officinalis TaxID=3572 RepID=A0AAW1JQ69_SAPOF
MTSSRNIRNNRCKQQQYSKQIVHYMIFTHFLTFTISLKTNANSPHKTVHSRVYYQFLPSPVCSFRSQNHTFPALAPGLTVLLLYHTRSPQQYKSRLFSNSQWYDLAII